RVAFEADHAPAAAPLVPAVLRNAEASLHRVADEQVEERTAAPRIALEHAVHVERGDHLVLLRGREAGEGRSGDHGRHLVHAREAGPVDVAQPDERSENRIVEIGAGDGGGAEQLGAPADVLHARQWDELLEAVARTLARGRAVVVVGKGSTAAE